jgi:hypothetical protein
MNKIFTLKPFNLLQRTLLVAVIVFASAFLQPNIANPGSIGIGVQVKNIKCYPNPAISFVNFEFPVDYTTKGYSIQVYSFTGKKMYESVITSVKSTLTFTSDFYRGIYIYQCQDKAGKIIETGKFQVNR